MKEQGNKTFWSRWSGFYDRFMYSNARLYDAIAAKMKGSLNRQMNVLELACGTGLISGQIAGSVKSIEATDFSPEMIAEAKKKPHSARLHYSVQDATNLPYGSETFDAVVITNALHIMPEPEKALSEARRVLKENGILIAPTFVHGGGRLANLRTWCMERSGFRAYHRWNAGEFVSYLSRQGFWVVEHALLGNRALPLCYAACRWVPPEYLASQNVVTVQGQLE